MVTFAPMQLVRFLRRPSICGLLGMLLITVFVIKSCDLFIDHVAHHKSVSVQNPGDDDSTTGSESKAIGEDSFEKSAKKLYSCFENPTFFRSLTWAAPLSVHWDIYVFGIFTEPLRVVLTPPPNLR